LVKKKKSDPVIEESEEVVEEIEAEEVVEEIEAEEVVIEVVDTEKQLSEMTDKFMRLNAEFMNFKKRTEKEKADIYKYANEKLFMELLPVIDNIGRALDSIEGADDHKLVLEGVNLVKKSFDDFLEKNGVKVIDAVGKPFDPMQHHAVMTEENDECDDETVLDAFQVGYTLNEKVIRPSMVKVSKKS
jgi:molecular chaperone GrpE